MMPSAQIKRTLTKDKYKSIVVELKRLLEEYHQTSTYSREYTRNYDILSTQLNAPDSSEHLLNIAKTHTQSVEYWIFNDELRIINFYSILLRSPSILDEIKKNDKGYSSSNFKKGIGLVLLNILTFPIAVPLLAAIAYKTNKKPLDLFKYYFETYAQRFEDAVLAIQANELTDDNRQDIIKCAQNRCIFHYPKPQKEQSPPVDKTEQFRPE